MIVASRLTLVVTLVVILLAPLLVRLLVRVVVAHAASLGQVSRCRRMQ
jgi:hypothetical protein